MTPLVETPDGGAADRSPPSLGHLRIGELSRRSGASPAVLRAWERRYGLLQPTRSDGNFRLYTDADERRIRRMQGFLASGVSASQAAALALARETTGEQPPGPPLQSEAAQLTEALDRLDDEGAERVLDRLFAAYRMESVLQLVVMPYLHELGERWAQGTASIAQEHFASNLIRGRLLGIARGWGQGSGPLAVLACLAGEQHDLGLLSFGLALRSRGWRITYLGPDTPVETVASAARPLQPGVVVLSGSDPQRFLEQVEAITELAGELRVLIAGAGADEAVAGRTGATLLQQDPVTAAEVVDAARAG